MVSSKLGLGGGGSGGGGGGNKEEEREMKRTGNIFRARKTGNASPGTEKEKELGRAKRVLSANGNRVMR